MTTGRINQITIVRRGETATGAASSAGEMSSSLGGVRRRAGQSTCGEAVGAVHRQSAFPLMCSPARPSAAQVPWPGSATWARQEKDSAPAFSHVGVQRTWLPSVALWIASQRPVIHRTHPFSVDCRSIRHLRGSPSTPWSLSDRFRGGRRAIWIPR